MPFLPIEVYMPLILLWYFTSRSGVWRSRFRCCVIRVSRFVVFVGLMYALLCNLIVFPVAGILLKEFPPDRTSLTFSWQSWYMTRGMSSQWVIYCLSIFHFRIFIVLDIVFVFLSNHAPTAITGWLSFHISGSAGSEVPLQHQSGWTCLWPSICDLCGVINSLLFLVCVIFRFWIISLTPKKT